MVLVLSGVSARWFPLLQPGCFYRLIAANTQDPSVLIGGAVSGRRGVELHADSTLQVRTDWRFHTLTRPLLLHTCTQTRSPPVSTLSEVLDCSSEVVCFQAQVTDRISVTERSRGSAAGVCAGVRLTVCDQSGRSLQVYLDLSHTPYPPGLLPGNTLLLSAFQRRVSRSGGVYCSQLPVSSLTITSLGDSSCGAPSSCSHDAPGCVDRVSREQRCFVGRVRGHVVCLLLLQLRWSCSLCGGLYIQSCSSAQCGSSSSVFQSTVKLVIDDGTGEAHVWFSGAQVRALLGLADSQWEGLQRALRVRGHIRVYPRGRSLLSLTCRKQKAQRSEEMKRFSRGDRDFMTRVTPPLKLTCTHLHSD
ncbi:hypothetical protein JOQ06_024791 [Pogonophryne albipinna]|uniref:CST complex subunit CTC1 n=1 Tax=Pogonophryne albipinna TaxID=1090488 RepID=A0AAD6A5M9_9TELE|nr:hypothetical protein JOQ06_024791 [Pogonophryne albipinna]